MSRPSIVRGISTSPRRRARISSSVRDRKTPYCISIVVKISAWMLPWSAMKEAWVSAFATMTVSSSVQVARTQASARSRAPKRSSPAKDAMGATLVRAAQSGVSEGVLMPPVRKSRVGSVHPPLGWASYCALRHLWRFSAVGASL